MTVVPTTTRDIYLPDELDHPALADQDGIELVQAIHKRKQEANERRDAKGTSDGATCPAEAEQGLEDAGEHRLRR